MGELVRAGSSVYQIRCIARGNYQLYNGKHSEHKVWAPKKVHGWKLFELIAVKGQIGYIGGRRVKGAFVVKDILSGKTLIEVTPRKLRRLSCPVQGLVITRFPVSQLSAKEGDLRALYIAWLASQYTMFGYEEDQEEEDYENPSAKAP